MAGERDACAYAEVYGLPVVARRYVTVCGPRIRPDVAISNVISRCVNRKPPVVYGDGTRTRGFTGIDDAVEANLTLLETDAADGEVLGIGSTDTIEVRTLAAEVRGRLAPDPDLEYAERHDADRTHADTSKAAERLGYEPSHAIREGVGEFVEWYRESRKWREPPVLNS